MNHTDQIILLRHLKTLPRQGQGGGGGGGDDDPLNKAEEAYKKAKKKAEDAAKDIESTINGIAGATEQAAAQFNQALTGAFGNAIIEVTKRFTFLEERNRSLNDSLGIASKLSADLGATLDTVTKKLSVGGDTARKLAISLNSVAEGLITAETMQTNFGEAMLAGQSYMRNQIKVSEKAAQGYELYAAGLGRSSAEQLLAQDELAKGIETATELQGVQRDLTETIGNLTSDLQVQYSRIPGSLELAILKSRALGMSMADLNKTGQNLLNIESSIGQELEYQLLTGRRLTDEVSGDSLTNAYREATLRGDANKQAEVMNRILEQEGKTLQNNLLARQQMAKLLGTDEATIARSLQKKKLLAQLGAEDIMELSADDAKREIEKLRDKYKDDKTKQKQIDDLLKASDTRTTAERTADAVEKIATAMIPKNQAQIIKDTVAGFSQQVIEDSVGGTLETLTKTLDPVIQVAASTQTIAASIVSLVGDIKTLLQTGTVQIKDTELGGVNTTKANDAIIQFNPRDKFMKINDGAMLASTDEGQLNKAAQTLVGSSQSSINRSDMQMMASMIAAAVANTKLSVEMPLGSASELNNGRFS
jgi:transcriptional regulator with XRE-family HTH domain